MRPTLSCPLGAQLSPRGRWVVNHRLGWVVEWTSIPQLSLAPTSTFPSFLYSTESWWQSHQSKTGVLLGGSKGPICPYSFHCRLLELVTPEKILYWQGMQGTQLLRGPLSPRTFSVTSQKKKKKQNLWLLETLLLSWQRKKASWVKFKPTPEG